MIERMTGQQRVAFLNPCLEAGDCTHQRYRSVRWLRNGWYASVMLTANIGEE